MVWHDPTGPTYLEHDGSTWGCFGSRIPSTGTIRTRAVTALHPYRDLVELHVEEGGASRGPVGRACQDPGPDLGALAGPVGGEELLGGDTFEEHRAIRDHDEPVDVGVPQGRGGAGEEHGAPGGEDGAPGADPPGRRGG